MSENQAQPKLEFVGKVVSDKMDKTRVIEVQSRKTHPKYKKTYSVTRRFVAHDEENQFHTGDTVVFSPTRPYSRTKKFIIVGKK